jgi:predicted DNA-binding transcriptional regulator AlpA
MPPQDRAELQNGRQFFAAKEAANIIGVSVKTLWAWSKRRDKKKRPPVRKFGHRTLRFPVKEFLEWAKNQPQGDA